MMTRRHFGLSVMAGAACAGWRVSAQQASAWETGRIAVPGGKVFWRALGKGPKLPLLAVHGGPSGASSKPFELAHIGERQSADEAELHSKLPGLLVEYRDLPACPSAERKKIRIHRE